MRTFANADREIADRFSRGGNVAIGTGFNFIAGIGDTLANFTDPLPGLSALASSSIAVGRQATAASGSPIIGGLVGLGYGGGSLVGITPMLEAAVNRDFVTWNTIGNSTARWGHFSGGMSSLAFTGSLIAGVVKGGSGANNVEAQGPGSYTNTHASGKTYSGKGAPRRMAKSAAEKAENYNDPVVSQDHTPAETVKQSYIDEQNRIEANGGPQNNTYNKINSPGKRLRDGG
jgi:hypothetical protein